MKRGLELSPVELSARIEELRKINGFTQAQLYPVLFPEGTAEDPKDRAKIAKRKYSPENVEQLSVRDLNALADLFGVDVDYLLCRLDDRTHDLAFLKIETGLDETALAFLKAHNFGGIAQYKVLRDDCTFENRVHCIPGLYGANVLFEDDSKMFAVVDSINQYVADLYALQETRADREKFSEMPEELPGVGSRLEDDERRASAAADMEEAAACDAFRALLDSVKKKRFEGFQGMVEDSIKKDLPAS